MFGVTILGNNSAVPAFDRHPTSQVVTLNGHQFLVDCGEGTQIQLINYKVRRSKISHIFISHLHGDHYFGLVGLLNSFGLLSRLQDLHVYGPAPLHEIIEMQLRVADTRLPYKLQFHTLTNEAVIVEENDFRVRCFRTTHRIECFGFVFEEKKQPRKLVPGQLRAYDIPSSFYDRMKWGEDYITKTGERILNEWVTVPNRPPRSYAFCADTRYEEGIIPHIRNVNLVYHETTYLDNLRERAEMRFHCTSKQAASIAKQAGAGRLLVGHFSSKYDVLDDFETEAREIFPNTSLALEGVTYLL